MSDMKVWMDGALVDVRDAKVSVLDHGLLYGDGVFEGIRIRHGRIFRLDDHLHRLERQLRRHRARAAGWSRLVRATACLAAARALDADEAYLRLVVTRGVGPLGIDPTSCESPFPLLRGRADRAVRREEAREGARPRDVVLAPPSVRRAGPAREVAELPEQRAGQARGQAAARRRRAAAQRAGARGRERGGQRVHRAARCAADAARRAKARSRASRGAASSSWPARKSATLGLRVEEVPLARADLLDADEVFLTGSGAGVARVASLDGVALRDGRDPLRPPRQAARE
jgi:branched-chain amino acid aminotransferase